MIRALLCVAVLVSTVPAAVRAREQLHDGQIAVGLAAVVVLCSVIGVGLRPALRGARWSPAVAATTVAASCVIALALPLPPAAWIPFLGVWAAAVCGLSLAPAAALGAAPVAVIAWRSWRAQEDPATVALNVAVAVAVFALSWARVRQREDRELAQAQRLVIELEQARTETRERQREVAARLHDVLAHTLSGLIVTLHGVRATARTSQVPAELVERLDAAIALARDGLVEARRAVESLHEESAEVADPGGDDLARWLDQALDRLRAGAGLEVSVTGAVQDLPPRWSGLARSVLMEALTNTVRHAAGAPVRITVTGAPHPGLSVLSVGDPDRFAERDHPGGGHGLDGLSDRARALGATVGHGPTDEGFAVHLQGASGPEAS